MWRTGTSVRTLFAWILGQVVAIALAVFLYLTHISKIKGTTMAEQAFDGWLRKSYFHPGDNPLTFFVTRSFSFFQYIFGQLVIGDVVALLFVAGLIVLRKVPARQQRYEIAALLFFPFLLNYAAALFDLYPYGGTRHCIFLAMFAITGVSICVASLARQSITRGIAISLVIIATCWLFRTNHAPYIARADQSRAQMDRAVVFIKEQMPQSQAILADYESAMELGHYLCAQEQVSYDHAIPGFLGFHCAEHDVISTVPDVWAFTPPVFLQQWGNLVRSGYLKPGEEVWVVQAGWMVKLDEDLRKEFLQFRSLKTLAFGNNIRFFQLSVGQPMPSAAVRQAPPYLSSNEALVFGKNLRTPRSQRQAERGENQSHQLFRVNAFHVDHVGLGIQSSVKFYFFPNEGLRHFLIVEVMDPAIRGKHELPSLTRHTIKRTGGSRLSGCSGLGFQHLLMRFGQRMSIKRALAVGYLPVKHRRLLRTAVGAEDDAQHGHYIQDFYSRHAQCQSLDAGL